MQFYTKCTILKALSATLETDLGSLHYISIKYDNSTRMISMPTLQAYVVYAYENQGLFLNILAVGIICNFKFSLRKLCFIL